jgi:hypothetical protein
MKETVDRLELNMNQRTNITAGVKEGTQDSWAKIISLISLAATIIMGAFYIAHWGGK